MMRFLIATALATANIFTPKVFANDIPSDLSVSMFPHVECKAILNRLGNGHGDAIGKKVMDLKLHTESSVAIHQHTGTLEFKFLRSGDHRKPPQDLSHLGDSEAKVNIFVEVEKGIGAWNHLNDKSDNVKITGVLSKKVGDRFVPIAAGVRDTSYVHNMRELNHQIRGQFFEVYLVLKNPALIAPFIVKDHTDEMGKPAYVTGEDNDLKSALNNDGIEIAKMSAVGKEEFRNTIFKPAEIDEARVICRGVLRPTVIAETKRMPVFRLARKCEGSGNTEEERDAEAFVDSILEKRPEKMTIKGAWKKLSQ